MSNNGSQLTLKELLTRHNRIRVPLIQRDYAQGRDDQEELRNKFLDALFGALQKESPINLDFIYGSVEGDDITYFQPLDGQQRITTLFLLHWYLAWRDGCSDDFKKFCIYDNYKSRFTYEVRPSSKEFFDELVFFVPEQSPEALDEDLSSFLQDQSWYYRNWRLDPTIQSALEMLNAINERFKNTRGFYHRLTDTEQPAITFQLLDLNNFGLSDDLYIKMNSRGKPLTPFENFKARYEKLLEDMPSDMNCDLNGQSVSVAEYFSQRIDTHWAKYFFWPFRDKHSKTFDAAAMNLFRVIILITRTAKTYESDITDLRSKLKKNNYYFFQKWLDDTFTRTLIALLDVWSKEKDVFVPLLPDGDYFDEKKILDKLMKDYSELTYSELVQLAAYAQFVRVHQDNLDPKAFQEWMRVVYNLSINKEYNRASDLQSSLEGIAALTSEMSTILEFLDDSENSIKGFYNYQVTEERTKAHLILADDSWRPLIYEAEGHDYFQGQISFLLEFAEIKVDKVNLKICQDLFADYLCKAQAMFSKNGLGNIKDFKWQRALLSFGNYLIEYRQGESLLKYSQSGPTSWKRLLRDSKSGSELHMLWSELNSSSDFSQQLDEIISSKKVPESEQWRATLIAYPIAISYCDNRMIRRIGNSVYLLKHTQLNGKHAELYSYCLFQNVLQHDMGRFRMLKSEYHDTSSTDDPPGISLICKYRDNSFELFLQYKSDGYLISTASREIPESLTTFLEDLGFTSDGDSWSRTCPTDSIEEYISELDNKLSALNRGELPSG